MGVDGERVAAFAASGTSARAHHGLAHGLQRIVDGEGVGLLQRREVFERPRELTVARKTREVAVRVALGASPAILLGAIIRYASLLMALGLAMGLVGALSLTRVLNSLLFEISSTDLATLAIVVLTLGVTALVAGIVPAWRATSVDPWVALRAD